MPCLLGSWLIAPFCHALPHKKSHIHARESKHFPLKNGKLENYYYLCTQNLMIMSKFVVYLQLQPFVAQWLHHHYGNPVHFQPQSVENSTILQFTRKLPEGHQPDTAAEGLTAVCIPDNEKKDPAIYNYLGPKGKEAVVDCIERTFKLMMWNELNDMSDVGCSVLSAIDAWCEMHGIDIEYDRTILMRYNRLRNSYVKKGIDLRRKRRNLDKSFNKK